MLFSSSTGRSVSLALLIAAGLTTPLAAASGDKKPPANAAAQAAPAATPVSAEPGLTTASFGDWQLRCQRSGTDAAATRICEVGQSIQVQGQQNPIARLAIGKVAKTDPLRVTILLPSNVSFPSSVRVGPAPPASDASGVDLPWRRCLPGICVADVEIKDETLKAWRGMTDPGRIAFKDAGGRDIAIPLSFKGLPQALDALAKE